MDPAAFDNTIPTMEYFSQRIGSPSWIIEQAVTDFIDITYITKGSAVYTVNDQKVTVEEGDLLCIPLGSKRSAMSYDPMNFECFAANFYLHTHLGEQAILPLPIKSNVGINPEIISQYRKLNESWLSRHIGYMMRTRAMFMLILQRYMSMLVYDVDAYNFDIRIKHAIRYITDNYANQITIASVANSVSLNQVYFGALFKKETRSTFRDYLNQVRLNQAEDMLRTGKWNVTEVAQNCGFTDVFYFSRLFKKYKGIPPSSVLN